MNLIVLDAKDYDGFVTYRSKVPLAVETGASQGGAHPRHGAHRSLRARQGDPRGHAHQLLRGRVHRQGQARARAVARTGPTARTRSAGSTLPTRERSAYILDLVKEALDFGVDEIQLDYVRYPVLGIKNADFDATKGKTHEDDRHPRLRATRCTRSPRRATSPSRSTSSALSPRASAPTSSARPGPGAARAGVRGALADGVPSHYRAGYAGFDVPGNHPEIVGMATRKILAMLKHKKKHALMSSVATSASTGIRRSTGRPTSRPRFARRPGGEHRLADVEPGADVHRDVAGDPRRTKKAAPTASVGLARKEALVMPRIASSASCVRFNTPARTRRAAADGRPVSTQRPGSFSALERNAADGRLGVLFDLLLGLGRTVPVREQEIAFATRIRAPL